MNFNFLILLGQFLAGYCQFFVWLDTIWFSYLYFQDVRKNARKNVSFANPFPRSLKLSFSAHVSAKSERKRKPILKYVLSLRWFYLPFPLVYDSFPMSILSLLTIGVEKTLFPSHDGLFQKGTFKDSKDPKCEIK